jgi:L-malate glycosyltransferase
MKIVHVVYSLEMGGAEVLVGQLCRIQRAEGHDVSVCAYSKLGVIGEALQAEGFDIRVMGVAHPSKTMLRYLRLFRKVKPDVVHCHNVAPTLQAALSARLAGVRRVITTRHRLPMPHEVATEVKYSLMCTFCDWVAGICEATCNDLRGAPLARLKKIVRVYNGTAPVERVNFDELGKYGFTIVVIGRLAPVKDVGTLIRAVALALPRLPELAFWVVGDGKVRPELEALTQELGLGEHVRFWGQQMHTAPFYSAADAFVMSSLSEGLPMSLLQSMSLGTPAILTDVEGSGEVLRLTGGGLLVPVKSPEAMADAIVRLATDPELRAEFSRKALTAYKEQFTLERMNDGYMKLYA